MASMVIKATSFKDVSLMAMVPERECKMPILIGDVSLPLGASGVAAGAVTAAVAALGAAGAAGAGLASGPFHPAPATLNKQRNEAEATDQLFISGAPSKRC